MVDDGILKLDQTTLSEIIRVVPHEMIKEFRLRHKTLDDVPDTPDSEFIILSDDKDNKLLDMMYKRYIKLNEKVGKEIAGGDFLIFRDFILNSYREICEKHSCSKVVFYLILKNQRVSLCARHSQ